MTRACGAGWELRLGRWQDVLVDVDVCDAVITDPPFSERTHASRNSMSVRDAYVDRRQIGYAPLTVDDATAIAARWSPVSRGWVVIFGDTVVAPWHEAALAAAGRYVFAPLPFVETGSRVRLAGDGPSAWTCWIVVARPRTREMATWGTLPGAYVLARQEQAKAVVGGKPLGVMRAIIRDYTRPGDLVVDPYAGGGTTLLAAVIEGRRAIGAELDPVTYEMAVARLETGYTRDLFADDEADV